MDLKGRTTAIGNFFESVRRSNAGRGNLSTDIDGALISMRRSMQIAEQAANSGNAPAANQFMDQAEKYLEFLQKKKDE